MMPETWILIIGLAWGNPDSRVNAPGDVIKIEHFEMSGTQEECFLASKGWRYENMSNTGFPRAFATCIRKEGAK